MTNDSDDIEAGSTLRDILADLQIPPRSSPTSVPAEPSWMLPPYTPRAAAASNTPRGPPSPMPRTSSAGRPTQQNRSTSASQIPPLHPSDVVPPSNVFDPPARSIFTSGPPTASVSALTAQASTSSAASSSSTRPLAALSASNGQPTRRSGLRMSETLPSSTSVPIHSRRRTLPAPEKDIDDPSSSMPPDTDLPLHHTSTTLSRFFAAGDGAQSLSRGPSHLRSLSGIPRQIDDTTSLTSHLLHRGFMDGRHSDITVHAFGQHYRLHRLLLDRVPFFSSAFSGSWAESSAHEMTLHPEDIDSNITQAAFELALKRIYGAVSPSDKDHDAVGLFATSCWLDMADLVDSSVDSLLRQMHPSKLDMLIKLVTSNYYGKAGDRILASAKAMLCQEGWEMPYDYWDGIPAEIVREVIGGDPFYVPGEWERWFITLKILNRRLKAKAIDANLLSPAGRYLQPKPTSLKFFAVRFDSTYRRDSIVDGRSISDKDAPWMALYTSPEIAPLLVLLDEGIHYMHLRFEQLQQIRTQRDILGVPVLPDKVVSNALWMSVELRQRIVNAQEDEMELGLSEITQDYRPPAETEDGSVSKDKDKRPENHREVSAEVESGSWDRNGRPRKFWIPSTDSSSVMGGAREAYLAPNSTGRWDWTSHMSRLWASLEPSDVAWASDMAVTGGDSGRPTSRNDQSHQVQSARYSHYPPFRFSAEFPNPRTLKEKKRVYSQTVWYAGSMWNLYIQRVKVSKNQQLGIYLHRAKDKDPSDDPLAQFISYTVDDRIGLLEQEMLLRKNERRSRHWRSDLMASGGDADPDEGDGSVSGGEGETNTSSTPGPAGEFSSTRGTPGMSTLLRRSSPSNNVSAKLHKTSQTHEQPASGPTAHRIPDSDEENEALAATSRRFAVSALPPYVDGRPTIKTYFKIYSPSKAGRMLSIYESAPDKFNFSQSWGWKSSQIVLDEGLGVGTGTGLETVTTKVGREGKLRYMVVIGNV